MATPPPHLHTPLSTPKRPQSGNKATCGTMNEGEKQNGESVLDGTSDPKGNDPSRFCSVIESVAPRLLRFLEMRTGSRQDAQDLAQEAYYRLCRVPEPELIRAPESYLFRIASNLANEHASKRRIERRHLNLDDSHEEIESAESQSFNTNLEARSEIEQLERIITDLPPLYQAVLLLRKRDGYSHQEIAEKLSISQHTVHKYLSRALLRCRTLWAERFNDE